MEYDDILVKELRQCQLSLLRSLDEVCKKLNISYFLDHGTLIGAVRHQGFIPWDDDIDIGMLRKDYEIFISRAYQFLPDYYFLQTNETEPDFYNNFAKLRDERTCYIESKYRDKDIHHGVFIDIFPFDYYPDHKFSEKIFNLKRKFLKRRIEDGFLDDNRKKLSKKGQIVLMLSKMIYPDIKKAVKVREGLLKSVPESRFYWCSQGIDKIPVEWLSQTVKLSFEGLMVSCPLAYDSYLTKFYGDYMQIPPVKDRVGHHYYECIDLHRSYKEYMKEKRM